MISRSIFRRTVSWIWAVAMLLTPQILRAEDPPTSCQETTERVLKPFLDRLEAAREGARQYEELNAENIATINEQIRLRQEAKKFFDDARDQENEDFGNRIKWGNEAIQEATADAQKRIAELRKAAAEARAAGRERDAQHANEAADKIAADLAAGKISWYKNELGLINNINGWRDYVVKQTQERAKRMAAYAAGEVSHYIAILNWHSTWKGVLASIEEKREELAKAESREYSYYLSAVNAWLTGQGMDDHLALRQDELDDARARIAAGTFVVFVPALGMHTDRNGVQKIVAEARDAYRKTVNAWGAKEYSNYNPLCGSHLTNGAIEDTIAKKQQELADFQAAGEDARVFAAGNHRTAREIHEQIGFKQALGDRDGYEQWHKILAAWRQAQADWIAAKQKEIEHWQAVLAKHEEVHKEDLKNQKADIDGRLQDALNQTPCGGTGGVVDPNRAVVDRQREELDGLSESEEERQRRRDWYDDKIYIERDGTVHGDPREAWLNALRDTGLTPDQQKSLVEQLLGIHGIIKSKDFVDYLEAFKDANEIREATRIIEEFIQAMEGIDIRTMKNADYFARRREIRAMLPGVREVLQSGALSPSRLQRFIDALVKSGSGTKATRNQIRMLNGFLEASEDAKNLWRSTRAWSSLTTKLAADAGQAYTNFVSSSATDIAQHLDDAYAGMSKFEKGLLVLSITAAAADAYDRMEKGTAPSDAIARSSVNFVIDMAIAGVPVTAAAEIATQILFSSYAYATGDEAVGKATLSNTSKWLAEEALNKVADGAAYLGEASMALDRMVCNEPNISQILGNVNYDRLRQSLSRVEDQLDALPPRDANEARLMRMRETFRILIRAKRQQG